MVQTERKKAYDRERMQKKRATDKQRIDLAINTIRDELENVKDDIRWADGGGELERLLMRHDKLIDAFTKIGGHGV